jgi:hypothetical protein
MLPGRPPHRSAIARLAALAVDGATYLIIPALLLPLGLLLTQRGLMLSSLAVNALALALVIAPATAWAAWCEGRPRGANRGQAADAVAGNR